MGLERGTGHRRERIVAEERLQHMTAEQQTQPGRRRGARSRRCECPVQGALRERKAWNFSTCKRPLQSNGAGNQMKGGGQQVRSGADEVGAVGFDRTASDTPCHARPADSSRSASSSVGEA